jgi:hypothetical protein
MKLHISQKINHTPAPFVYFPKPNIFHFSAFGATENCFSKKELLMVNRKLHKRCANHFLDQACVPPPYHLKYKG